MKKLLIDRCGLSEKGASAVIKAGVWHALLQLVKVLPLGFAFYILEHLVEEKALEPRYILCVGLCIVLLLFVVIYKEYNATYTQVYEESAAMRFRLGDHLRNLPLSYFAKNDAAQTANLIIRDVTMQEQLFSHMIPSLLGSILACFFLIVMLFIYQPYMAFVLCWPIPIGIFLVVVALRKNMRSMERVVEAKNTIAEALQEGIETAPEIRQAGLQTSFLSAYRKALKDYVKKLIHIELLGSVQLHSCEAVFKLGLASVLFFGVRAYVMGSIDFFVFVGFLLAAGLIYTPIVEACSHLLAVVSFWPYIERTASLLKEPTVTGKESFQPKNYDVVFENVSFSYDNGVPVLRGVSLKAKQGEVTALVGPSGSGKTTLMKLLPRFYDYKGGKITVGGVDIKDVHPETLQEAFSMVFQDVVLFNDTVLENIRIGKKDATDEEVLKVAEIAGVSDFLSRLPMGIKTIIGENGTRLSGGERQRISIARALLKDAPIVLLDEATASLDVESETNIQQALSRLMHNKTVIVVAHRLRTVASADAIWVLKDGTVVEHGNRESLLAQQGLFAKLEAYQHASSTWRL